MKQVYLDGETTGLDPCHDELLEIGIVDDDGQTLLASLIRPLNNASWPDAECINGISPSMVVDAPTLDELMPAIQKAVEGCRVIIYNEAFDTAFLPEVKRWAAETQCAMVAFAEVYGEWDDYYGGYRWQKLFYAAQHVFHQWEGQSHRAVSDALACRSVWHYITIPEERHRVDITREALRCLKQEEREQHYLQSKHEFRMATFWEHWWLGRYGIEQHWANGEYDVKEALAEVFFGKPLSLLKLEDLELPKYHKKVEIPDGYHGLNWFPAQGWVRERIKASAVYIGKRTGWLLYHESELTKLIEEYPLRFVKQQPGEKTKTELRRMGYRDEDIMKMKPVREAMNMWSFEWYHLYLVN